MSSNSALTVLSRLAQRKPEAQEWLTRALVGRLEDLAEEALEVAMETGGPIGSVLADQVRERALPDLTERLMQRCNERDVRESVYVLEVGEAATRNYLSRLQSALPMQPGTDQLLELSRALDNLGTRTGRLGKWPQALQYHQKAAEVRRKLVDSGVKEARSELVISLTNIGQVHGSLGDWGEAFEVTQEALKLLLGSARGEVEISALALSHRNLGIILSELGRSEEALASNREALELHRKLAAQNPLVYLPQLARDLLNSAGRLRELGRVDEALGMAQEALEIRKELAAERPESFLPVLALTHHNLGVLLHELGRVKEGFAETQEGLRLRRELATARPEAFLADLASSLYNFGNRLSEMNRLNEALAVAEEIIECYLRLVARSPRRFLPDLADRLAHRCELLLRRGQMDELFVAAEEGLRHLIPHLADHREALSREMASLFDHYLKSSAATGRTRDPGIEREIQPGSPLSTYPAQ